MTAWWTGHALGLDFETDSADPHDARIITAHTALIQPDATPQRWDWIAKPERDIPADAANIHGYTTERATELGRDRAEVVNGVVDVLARLDDVTPLVGHNISYDLTVLDREMRRLNLGSVTADNVAVTVTREGREVAAFPVLDTLVLDKAIDRFRAGKNGRRLAAAAAVYGVALSEQEAHTAGEDVRAALHMVAEIARRCDLPMHEVADLYADRMYPARIAARFGSLRGVSVGRLHRWQVGWATLQAAELAHWAGLNPDKTDIDPGRVCGDWPLRPWRG